MLICHLFLLFQHCLLSLTTPLQLPYNATYHTNHATWHDAITSTHTQHYYRHLIILVIGLRCSTQAPCFTAPFIPHMTLLGFMCPGPGKLIRSQALSHHAINRPHDTLLFSHSLSPDQLPLLCTSFSFASYHMVYGAHAATSTPTIAFVLISPVHTDKKKQTEYTPSYISHCVPLPHTHTCTLLYAHTLPHTCTSLTLAPHLFLHSPTCSHL